MNYQNEQFEDADIALLRAKVQVAIDELDRGEGVPLDIEDIIARGKERLAARCDESAETR